MGMKFNGSLAFRRGKSYGDDLPGAMLPPGLEAAASGMPAQGLVPASHSGVGSVAHVPPATQLVYCWLVGGRFTDDGISWLWCNGNLRWANIH